MRKTILLVSTALAILVLLSLVISCRGDKPGDESEYQLVVHAILFYSPACGHCHKVMTEDLPPLRKKYGKQLQILEVNVTTSEGRVLFHAARDCFEIENAGVPTMIIGDIVLQGSVDIPQQLPGLIETKLASGGVDWPVIPGFVPPSEI